MRELDDAEVKIVRELIRNPRISDNQIAKKTKVPVMTVNRKRKKLEDEGLLTYYTYLNTSEEGTGIFHARQMYIVKFKSGITRDMFLTGLFGEKRLREFNAKFIVESYLGEKDGQITHILILEAKTESELIEIFNGEIIPLYKKLFGEDTVKEVITARVTVPIRFFHNYLPLLNMEKGKIKEEWSNDYIFVTETEKWQKIKQEKLKNYEGES